MISSLHRLAIIACLAFAVGARAAEFAKGADVSWITEMEAKGATFANAAGTPKDCLHLLRELGMNSIRLRVWVNPPKGWSGEKDVVAKAVRARQLGFRIMIDFHYSDGWADPGKQFKPAAWAKHGIEELNTDVENHTRKVLLALKAAGVSPEWVQVGNETNDGMLWEDGRASTHVGNFAALVNHGYAAVKAVFPQAIVIVHLSNGYNQSMFRWMLDGLVAHGAKFDAVGMSLYPSTTDWPTLDQQCFENMKDVSARYGKNVLICEAGMDVNSPAAAKAFLSDIIGKTKAVPNGRGLGVFYWEPECYRSWNGYSMGAFDDKGRPTEALDAFK